MAQQIKNPRRVRTTGVIATHRDRWGNESRHMVIQGLFLESRGRWSGANWGWRTVGAVAS